jgi:hypothetical protein
MPSSSGLKRRPSKRQHANQSMFLQNVSELLPNYKTLSQKIVHFILDVICRNFNRKKKLTIKYEAEQNYIYYGIL